MIQDQKRQQEMLELRKQGFTNKEIGRKKGISGERVRQCIGSSRASNTERTRAKYEAMAKCYEAGEKIVVIAADFGYEPTSIMKIMQKMHAHRKNGKQELLSQGKRRCYRCHEPKLLKDFVKNTRSSNGYGNTCNECNRINSREYYWKNKVSE